ncbi:hypothetical protein [Streptomyces antarcticus]|uniref:hypothetical protein n=1 Tax=Streptomyces antarcticus TaxID=2996458 RepID=UPI0022701B5C|nr:MULTISPECIES: hypothetical protein [unclassified Streptomyces]MCY0941698.1 hypothetical protein [Streptomyces sp. H34-AA3]MCZ4084327.1 hypothetical protein [Streptomyces sp. H34-S5]
MASGGARWNADAQRWESGQEPAQQPPLPRTPPPLPPVPPRWQPEGTGDGAADHAAGAGGPGGPEYGPGPGYGTAYGPGSGGSGPGPHRPWRTPLLVALCSALVSGAAVAGWLALADDDPKTPAAPPSASGASGTRSGPATASPSGETSPSPSPSPTPSPTPGTPSPSYSVVRSDNGFSVAVPEGWRPSTGETGSGAFYRPPGDRSALLQVFRITEPAGVGSCDLLRTSSRGLDDGNPGYREVSVGELSAGSCELVYEYDSAEAGGRRRGIERIVVAPDGRRWALLAAGPAAEPEVVRARLTAAAESFRTD